MIDGAMCIRPCSAEIVTATSTGDMMSTKWYQGYFPLGCKHESSSCKTPSQRKSPGPHFCELSSSAFLSIFSIFAKNRTRSTFFPGSVVGWWLRHFDRTCALRFAAISSATSCLARHGHCPRTVRPQILAGTAPHRHRGHRKQRKTSMAVHSGFRARFMWSFDETDTLLRRFRQTARPQDAVFQSSVNPGLENSFSRPVGQQTARLPPQTNQKVVQLWNLSREANFERKRLLFRCKAVLT